MFTADHTALPPSEWEELGDRLSAEVGALLDIAQRLIAAKAESDQLGSQASEARMLAARIVGQLDALQLLGTGSLSSRPAAPDTVRLTTGDSHA